ncbi:MAG TPA: Arm DNA-binding domain-containing protein, partial [Gemmatimonadaceae bacterium]
MPSKITKKLLDAIKPKPTGDTWVWDTQLVGFGVRVKPSGATSYLVDYYAPGLHRVRRRMTVAAYPPTPPEDARKMATALLAAVAKGEDPALERTEQRRAA